MSKLYLCRDCGHVQKDTLPCMMCFSEAMDCYVKSFKPEEVKGLKYWTDRLAKKRTSTSARVMRGL